MLRSFSVDKTLYGRTITARCDITDNGISILVCGGDLSHIGAVTVIEDESNINDIVFHSHKEGVIASSWARSVYYKTNVPTVVCCGIHFDGITKDQIKGVLDLADIMLKELTDLIII